MPRSITAAARFGLSLKRVRRRRKSVCVSVTSTRAGSLVFGAGNDWDAATPRTVGAGQAMLHEYPDTVNGDDLWAQNVTAPTGVAGSTITVGDTAPTTDRWNQVAVEVNGLELAANWRASQNLTLTGAGLYNDATVRQASVAPALNTSAN